MNKKFRPLICIALIIIISIPVISIAFAVKPDKGPIEKKVFIHRVKPDNPGKPSKPDGNDKEWYKYSGIHWASDEVTYTVNTDGSGLYPGDAFDTIVESFETWDEETEAEVFGLGLATNTYDSSSFGKNDGVNVVVWGDYTSGVIAVTSIWYLRDSGEIVDVDTLFNTYYTWSLSGETDKMDLQNIATHEFGHWLVLDDMYNRPAGTQTMYGYSDYEEISKRDLDLGDIAGIEAIYGE